MGILDLNEDAFDEDGSGWVFAGALAIPVLLLLANNGVRGFLLLFADLFKSYYFTTNSAYWLFWGFLFFLSLLIFFFFRETDRIAILVILGVVSLAIMIIGGSNSTRNHFKKGVFVNESNKYIITKAYEYSDGRMILQNTELLATFSKSKKYVTEYTLLLFENDGSISIEHITCARGEKPFATLENHSQTRQLFNQPIRQESERQKQMFLDELDEKGIKLYQGNSKDPFLLQSIDDKKFVDVTSLSFFNDDDNANTLWYVERKDYRKYKRLYKKHKKAVCKFSFKYSMEITDGQYVLYYE